MTEIASRRSCLKGAPHRHECSIDCIGLSALTEVALNILFNYNIIADQKRPVKTNLLNKNRTFRPHGFPRQNREQSGEERVTYWCKERTERAPQGSAGRARQKNTKRKKTATHRPTHAPSRQKGTVGRTALLVWPSAPPMTGYRSMHTGMGAGILEKSQQPRRTWWK